MRELQRDTSLVVQRGRWGEKWPAFWCVVLVESERREFCNRLLKCCLLVRRVLDRGEPSRPGKA